MTRSVAAQWSSSSWWQSRRVASSETNVWWCSAATTLQRIDIHGHMYHVAPITSLAAVKSLVDGLHHLHVPSGHVPDAHLVPRALRKCP